MSKQIYMMVERDSEDMHEAMFTSNEGKTVEYVNYKYANGNHRWRVFLFPQMEEVVDTQVIFKKAGQQ